LQGKYNVPGQARCENREATTKASFYKNVKNYRDFVKTAAKPNEPFLT